MANKKHRSPFSARHFIHFSETLLLKFSVANGEHLINDQYLRLKVCGYRKCEANVHTAAVVLYRRVEKFLHVSKRDDVVKFLADLPLSHPENRAIEEDVLATSKLGMKSRPNLKQACDAPPQHNLSLCRLRDAAQDLEKCALSGAVTANDTKNLTLLDLEAHILERPELLYLIALNDLAPAEHVDRLARKVAGLAPDDVAQRIVVPTPFASSVAEQVALRKIFNGDDGIGHGCAIKAQIRSAKLFSIILNRRMPNQTKKAVTPILMAKPGR